MTEAGEIALVFGGAHAVVGNPPYIAVQDKVAKDAYRKRYVSAHGKACFDQIFAERLFQLAVPGGFVGQITSNAFMKRERGKPLVEKVLSQLDLTHVIDTSGAYIPGHGTPTVILIGRNQAPSSANLRAVLGKRGEPKTPDIHIAGAEIAHTLEKPLAALAADLRRESPGLSQPDAARCAASWALGCLMVQALETRRIGFERRDEHLGDTFARAWQTVAEGGWFAHDTDAWWPKTTPSRAASDALREAVDRLEPPSPADVFGRSGWSTTDTDFLGDAYQHMNEWAVKGLALVQTPRFVREFILKLTLDSALDTFGLDDFRALDPTCGAGHFLVDCFWSLYQRHVERDDPPEYTFVEAARRAMDSVLGADINPEVVELARYRLFLAYCDAAMVRNADSVFDLSVHVVAADSLLAGEVKPSPPCFPKPVEVPTLEPVPPRATVQLDLFGDAAEEE